MSDLKPIRKIFDSIPYVQRQFAFGGQDLKLWVVEDPNALMDGMTEADFGDEEKMPYWAALWPASLELANYMAGRGLPANARVLELGCGLGLNGILAAKLGAKVMVSDWYHEAVKIAAENGRLNGVEVTAAWMDWNKLPPLEPFDVILGSDILYEDRNHVPVLNALSMLLSKGGEAWLSDPGRAHLSDFVRLAEGKGWVVRQERLGSVAVVVLGAFYPPPAD